MVAGTRRRARRGPPDRDRNATVNSPETKSPDARAALGSLSRLARRVLLVERAWPPIVFALVVGVVFLAGAWLGAFEFAPRLARVAGVALFAIAAIVALAPLVLLRRPGEREVLTRLDRDAGTSHRPASSLADPLANDSDDPATRALWQAHLARQASAVARVRVAPPAPRMVERDPYALRFAAVLVAFAAAVIAGPEMYGRVAAAFDWRSARAIAAAAARSRIDAWIDPPPYAGQPPLVIDFKSPRSAELVVPEDSTLVVRGDPGLVETRIEGGIAPVGPKGDARGAARRPGGKAVDDPCRRQGDDPARRPRPPRWSSPLRRPARRRSR